jgi:hypothetical protein
MELIGRKRQKYLGVVGVEVIEEFVVRNYVRERGNVECE